VDELTSALRIGVEDDVTIPFDLAVRIHEALRTPAISEEAVEHPALTSFDEKEGLRQLGLLYNHADDDSRQFTRWQMLVAMHHGLEMALRAPAEEAVEAVARVLYDCEADRSAHADKIFAAARGKPLGQPSIEPYELCADTFRSDARAAIAALSTPPATKPDEKGEDLLEAAAMIVFEEVGNHTVCARVMHRIRSLRASPGIREAVLEEAWQPIETAPKDGGSVLIYSPDASDKGIMVGVWIEVEHPELELEWVDAVDGEIIDADPTHWRPLPEPPALTTTGKDSGGAK
jgi:hypothetical protein